MKNKLIILFLLLSIYAFSQTVESLKGATKNYYEASYLLDFEAIVSSSYPKMVESIGKDVMLEKIEQYYENEEYRIREQLETLPFQYNAIKKIEGKSFCVVTFRNPMRYFFEKKVTTEKAKWLKEINKTKDVTFEPNRNSFNVRRQTTYVGIMDGTTNNDWKFFNLDDANQLATFQILFGENVKKALGL